LEVSFRRLKVAQDKNKELLDAKVKESIEDEQDDCFVNEVIFFLFLFIGLIFFL